jgi:hypothetical protein
MHGIEARIAAEEKLSLPVQPPASECEELVAVHES